jgi:hypothetical protein
MHILIILLSDDEMSISLGYDSYNIVKYGTYQANRISFSLEDESRVEETYNERIFNCYCKYKGKEQLLQLRNANEICDFIIDKDKESFIELFKEKFYDLNKVQLLQGLIDNNTLLKGRVNRTSKDEFIVDDVFKVDSHANTYVLASHYIKKTKREKRWDNLCTVLPRGIKKRMIHTKEIGDVEVDEATLRCLGKIFGLVQPHTWDSVVWNQIPNWLKKIYKDELEAYNERIKA